MSLIWLVYLAGAIDGAKFPVGVILVIALITTVISGFFALSPSSDYEKEDRESALRAFKIAHRVFLAASVVVVLVPDSKTIYTMAAIKYGQDVIARPEVKVLGDKVYQILNQKLDDLIEKKK